MIGYAMARAVRRGWLDASYRPTIDLAWQGVQSASTMRADWWTAAPTLACRKNVQAYLDRPAIFGRDDRGGAMALWFAVELDNWYVRRGGDKNCYRSQRASLGPVQGRVGAVAII